MHIIAGLGNPGGKYKSNRHNIGFMAIDALHEAYRFPAWQKKFNAEIALSTIDQEKILLVKPQNFMNLSGQAIGQILRFYKLNIQDLTILHDDLDLNPGKIRIKKGGGSGGHNGIKSIDAHCGKDYMRMRLGIGHPGDKNLVHSYVLGDFSAQEKEWLPTLLRAIASHMPLYIQKQESLFLNHIHKDMNPAA